MPSSASPGRPASPVRLLRKRDVGVIEIDNPPVNALSRAVREGLLEALSRAAGDSRIRGIVLAAKGRQFIAGADLRELTKPPSEPLLPEVVAALDASDKPIVAAVGGAAFGGGLEVALACHRRVAAESARFGFPEVNLGLLPGAGGTQRLPRVVGAEAALEIICGGAPFGAKRAAEIGIVDGLASEATLMRRAFAECRRLAEGGAGRRLEQVEHWIYARDDAVDGVDQRHLLVEGLRRRLP